MAAENGKCEKLSQQGTASPQCPSVYANGVRLSVGPYDAQLTFHQVSGPEEAVDVIKVFLSLGQAKAIGQLLTAAVGNWEREYDVTLPVAKTISKQVQKMADVAN